MDSTSHLIEKYTALYSPLDVEYAQSMSGPYRDLSVRSHDCEVVAGLKGGEITGFWRPVVSAGNPILVRAKMIALASRGDVTYMDFLEGGELSDASLVLLKLGYKATPYLTQIIDLTQSIEALKGGLRKSYKSLVTKGNPRFTHNAYHVYEMRNRVKDTRSRPVESWKIQNKMCRQGQGFVVYDDDMAVMVYHNKYSAYYASAVSRDNANTHHLIWAAILEAKRLGCRMFEMGEQKYDDSISYFKRGFGGSTHARLILTKETNG